MSAPEHRELGPYGCLCRTLAIRMLGDGCDMCQPTSERRKGERRGGNRQCTKPIVDNIRGLRVTCTRAWGHDGPCVHISRDRRTADRRKAE